MVSQGSSVTLWVDGAYRKSSGCKAWRLGFRHSEASMGGQKKKKNRDTWSQQGWSRSSLEHPDLEGCALQCHFPSYLVGPAWCSCQQVSGTNDERPWAAQYFSKHSIPEGACRMASLYHTCPIAIVRQVIGHLHRVGGSCVFSSHVDGRLERLLMQQFSLSCCQWIWWLLVDGYERGVFLDVCSNNSRI